MVGYHSASRPGTASGRRSSLGISLTSALRHSPSTANALAALQKGCTRTACQATEVAEAPRPDRSSQTRVRQPSFELRIDPQGGTQLTRVPLVERFLNESRNFAKSSFGEL